MDYTGLLARKYRVNRKLTDEERSNQLRQRVRLNITPLYNLSVIRMNSTYLECVDRWFIHRGWMTAICILFFTLTVAPMLEPLCTFPHAHWRSDLRVVLFGIPFMAPLWGLLSWGLLEESFRWTHFPIRFNCRNRMVYVFRPDGTVLKAKWNKILFTLGRCQRISGSQNWDIRGHVLDKDRETVLATFALPGDSTEIEELKQTWEFFRRYMEEGPASVYRDVYWCQDIVGQRETYKAGLRNLLFPGNGFRFNSSLLEGFAFYCLLFLRALTMLFFPVVVVVSLGRWFAMRTSKTPAWPAEVEAQCAVDAFDPYRRDASHNPEKIPLESIRDE
jgi:hypothetical protein